MSGRLRLWRRVRLAPGLTMNFGNHGVSSFSFGRRGAHLTFGRRGTRATVGLPGSGIFYSVDQPYGRRTRRSGIGLVLVCVLVILAIAAMSH